MSVVEKLPDLGFQVLGPRDGHLQDAFFLSSIDGQHLMGFDVLHSKAEVEILVELGSGVV